MDMIKLMMDTEFRDAAQTVGYTVISPICLMTDKVSLVIN